MRKSFFTNLFIWCVVIGFASTTVAQDVSAGKVPMTTDPSVNYSITNDAPNADGTAYGWGSIIGQFLSMPIPAGDPFTLIAPMVAPGFLSSATFGPTGILYFTDTTTDELYTVDTGTGALTLVGSTGGAFLNGITYDWSNDTFYGVSATDLYTVDLGTGGLFIDCAADCAGNLYGYDLGVDNFYSIDKTTGLATLIGPLGYDANFGQGMSYDHATGILYLSAFNNTTVTGQLRSVDVTTGATTLVFDWGFEQVAPFAIDQTCGGSSGIFPEVLYYTFDEAGSDSTENFADPGSGFEWAQLIGAMSMGSAGQFGSAIVGTGTSSSTDYVNTGWIMDIGTGDWTISCWLDIFDESALHYIFGEVDVAFRCFYGGVAPAGGVVLRGGGLTDVPVTGLIPGPAVVHFVYDSSVPEVRTYVNGVFQSAVAQTAVDLTSTSDIFKVASRGTSTNLAAGELMDEFRFYNRALDSAEVADTWNVTIIPVELTSFTASVNDNDVTLSWETATELNNSGFEIERKSAVGEYDKIGFVPGFGTTTEHRAYSFSDANLLSGNYTYRLKQIDYDGTFEYSDPVEVEIVIPDVYSLHQNYPNPFNPSTTITFTLAANAQVTLKVFDILGQEVMTLINQDITAGVHTYDFDASGINTGVYFYRIEANGIDGTNFTSVKKMILLK
jgi:hypothetical protein